MIAPTDGALVLIVDDEPANIHLLAHALKDRYELVFATSAQRALEILAETEVHLVLLDVVMPGMNGHELLVRIQELEHTRAIPVIFVTARDEIEDEERGLGLGAVDYITKPISPPIVRARVRTHLELRRQRELQARMALLDGLTGIANRRCFDEQLERALRMAGRTGGGAQLLLLDVDHFKQYNDHYGHAAGDTCLKQVAAALEREFSRAGDLVARFGGEEFAVLLPPGEIALQAVRALTAIRRLALPHSKSPTAATVTISVGALALTMGQPAPVLIAAADVLLYQAKREGRNRAVWRDAAGHTHTASADHPPAGGHS